MAAAPRGARAIDYLTLKWLHVGFSTVLFGTGIGSAFYFLLGSRSGDARIAAWVAARVVVADWLFTTPMALLQPASGAWLLHLSGLPWTTNWIAGSLWLYAVALACWLPVVVLQLRMRDLARAAAVHGAPLPPRYATLLGWWCVLGGVAFVAFLCIFWLMVVKPV